ncbi:MAG: TrbC/VirB2 family protein [Edaphobacter sp.]
MSRVVILAALTRATHAESLPAHRGNEHIRAVCAPIPQGVRFGHPVSDFSIFLVSHGPTFTCKPEQTGKSNKEISPVKTFRSFRRRLRRPSIRWLGPSLLFLTALPVYAQTGSDPWDNAVNVLKTAFTGTIATGLSLVAIVVGGLMFAYGEGQSKKTIAGIVFGVGMAIGAVNFMSWLFPS